MLIKKHIAMFRQLHPNDVAEADAALVRVQSQAALMEEYYRFFAKGVWDVRVRGYVMFGTAYTGSPHYAASDINKYIQEHGLDGFEPDIWHVIGGYGNSVGHCGEGILNGTRSATFIGASCGIKTSIHEIGHNLGLHHASLKTSSGNVITYGDLTSDMGQGQPITGMNSAHLVYLGLESEREIGYIEGTQQILLAPIEMNKHGMHLNEYQHGIIRRTGHVDVNLSIRKRYGVPFPARVSRDDILYLHTITRDGYSIRLSPDMKVGDVRELESGVKVEFLEYKNETARVNIIYNSGDKRPDDIAISDKFPEMLPSAYLRESHSGGWHDPEYSRQGLQVMVRNGKMAVYWYTYNGLNSSRRYYYGVADYDGVNIPTFDLYTTSGGTWDDPSKSESIKVGIGRVYFLNDSYGVFNYNTEEHGRGNIELTPVALSNGIKSGSFWQPSRDGEGLTVDFYQGDTVCVAMWYSYGPKGRAIYGYQRKPIIQEQRWYEANGTLQDDGSYAMGIYEYNNNIFMSPDQKDSQTLVGTASLTMSDVDNLSFDFDLHSSSVKGKGLYNLVRLV